MTKPTEETSLHRRISAHIEKVKASRAPAASTEARATADGKTKSGLAKRIDLILGR